MPRSKFTEETEAAQTEALELLRAKMHEVASQPGAKGASLLLEYARVCHEMHVSSALIDAELDRLYAGANREVAVGARADGNANGRAVH